RDSLGEVDRRGHLVPYRPSTEKMQAALKSLGFKIGVITNLPGDISDKQGKDMVVNAVLSEDPATSKLRTIGDFVPRANIVTNHEAGVDKPDPKIYQFAAKKLGVEPRECFFIGENLLENLGAA